MLLLTGLILSGIGECSGIGSYARSIGIEDASQIKGAEADYMAVLVSFVRAGVMTADEAKMEIHSEIMRLNEGSWSNAGMEGYRRATLRDHPGLRGYKRQCFWVDARKDVQCKGQPFISEIGK